MSSIEQYLIWKSVICANNKFVTQHEISQIHYFLTEFFLGALDPVFLLASNKSFHLALCVCVLLIRPGHNMESSEPKAYLAFCVSIRGPVAMDTNQTDHNLHNDLFFSYLEPQIQSVPALEWCLPGLWVFSGSAIGVLTSCNVSIAFLSVICIFFFHSYCNKNRQNKVGSPLACSSDS